MSDGDKTAELGRVVSVGDRIPLYKGASSLHQRIRKGDDPEATQQGGGEIGEVAHPLNFALLKNLIDQSVHHGTCIRTKAACTTGLGFASGQEIGGTSADPTTAFEQMLRSRSRTKVDDVLDPLCMESFQDTLSAVNEDYEITGNGYMEVFVRGSAPAGINHLPAENVTVYKKTGKLTEFSFMVDTGDDHTEWLQFTKKTKLEDGKSYVLHFRKPTCLNRYYGRPDYLSAITPLDLMQCLQQYRYDFFNNRGVPEFMLFLLGQNVGVKEWAAIQDAMTANIGRGNSHKSTAVNIPNPDLKVQLEKLALDQSSFDDSKFKEGLALDIVSAHRVPPLLAGIQIPGKLGATNELPNALMAFQLLVIGQNQRVFQNKLSAAFSGLGGLTPQDFTLRPVTSIIDYQRMDTISRMRQTVPEAAAEGRSLDDGLKE